MVEKLIKSKKRVQQHGEVFTPTKIVNDMLNLEGLREKVEDIRGMALENKTRYLIQFNVA